MDTIKTVAKVLAKAGASGICATGALLWFVSAITDLSTDESD